MGNGPSPTDGGYKGHYDKLATALKDVIQVLEKEQALPIYVVKDNVQKAIEVSYSDDYESCKCCDLSLVFGIEENVPDGLEEICH